MNREGLMCLDLYSREVLDGGKVGQLEPSSYALLEGPEEGSPALLERK